MLAKTVDDSVQQLFSKMDLDMLEALGRVYVIILLVMLAYSVAAYVLHAMGLYTIAKRRGFERPWLAWVPVGRSFLLGSISDQYIRDRKYRCRSNGKLLACSEALVYIAIVAVLLCGLILLGTIKGYLEYTSAYENYQQNWYYFYLQGIHYTGKQKVTLNEVQKWLTLLEYLCNALVVVSLVYTILNYKMCYDLFASCRPDLKVVFLVLSILFPVTLPFFVFACRKHDLGMEDKTDTAAGNGTASGQVFSAGS